MSITTPLLTRKAHQVSIFRPPVFSGLSQRSKCNCLHIVLTCQKQRMIGCGILFYNKPRDSWPVPFQKRTQEWSALFSYLFALLKTEHFTLVSYLNRPSKKIAMQFHRSRNPTNGGLNQELVRPIVCTFFPFIHGEAPACSLYAFFRKYNRQNQEFQSRSRSRSATAG